MSASPAYAQHVSKPPLPEDEPERVILSPSRNELGLRVCPVHSSPMPELGTLHRAAREHCAV